MISSQSPFVTRQKSLYQKVIKKYHKKDNDIDEVKKDPQILSSNPSTNPPTNSTNPSNSNKLTQSNTNNTSPKVNLPKEIIKPTKVAEPPKSEESKKVAEPPKMEGEGGSDIGPSPFSENQADKIKPTSKIRPTPFDKPKDSQPPEHKYAPYWIAPLYSPYDKLDEPMIRIRLDNWDKRNNQSTGTSYGEFKERENKIKNKIFDDQDPYSPIGWTEEGPVSINPKGADLAYAPSNLEIWPEDYTGDGAEKARKKIRNLKDTTTKQLVDAIREGDTEAKNALRDHLLDLGIITE